MERNRDLFWKLLEPEHPRAEAFSRKLMGNREDGDDLYQDALVLALTGFSSLNESAAFRPWLYRIIVNCFKNRFRAPWYRRVIPLTAEISRSLSTADPNHEFAVGRLLQKALSAISSEERALITLFELEGWTVAELSAVYSKPNGTIKARLSRARKKMKRALADSRMTKGAVKSNSASASKVSKAEEHTDDTAMKSVSYSPTTKAKSISVVASTVSRLNQE